MRNLRPQRIEAHRQKELFCAMAFQYLEWHAIDGIDFDGVQNNIQRSLTDLELLYLTI